MTRHNTNNLDDRLDLEARLRSSLTERSTDVSASPELWTKVDDRITARRRTLQFALAGGTALAVAAAAFVVPGLLDNGPKGPQITQQPEGDRSTDNDGTQGDPVVVGSMPSPTHGLAVRDGRFVVIDLATTQIVGTYATGQNPVDIAVRPEVDQSTLEVAYVATDGADWQIWLGRFADAEGPWDNPAMFTSELVASFPRTTSTTDVLQPGVAWLPDGSGLAWVETIDQSGGQPVSMLQVQNWGAEAPLAGDGHPSFLLADGQFAGQLTLADWNWDAQYEDGRTARAYFTGGGRSWDLGLTIDADGSMTADNLNPIDYADDFDQSGPDYGMYTLFADLRMGELRVRPLESGQQNSWSFGSTREAQDTGPWDLATANGNYLISTGSYLFVGDQESTGTRMQNGEVWGPVDLISAAWLPAFEGEGSTVPDDEPTNQTDDPTPRPAELPEFIVTTDGAGIDLRWSDGRLLQTLHAADPDREGVIVGVDVKPGSSTEDITIIYTTSNDGVLTAWTLRGRADDQAGLAVDATPWPSAYQPTEGAMAFADGERAVPQFSGDGDFVAMVDNTNEGANLRIFGWLPGADVPGTGNTANDNASWVLGNVPTSLERFSDLGVGRSGDPGYSTELSDAAGNAQACDFDLQADGALTLATCESYYEGVVDFDLSSPWVLQVVDLTIELQDYSAQADVFLPIPTEIAKGDPASVWMTAGPGHAFVGDGASAWLVTHDGAQQLGFLVSYVVPVR